MNTILAFLSLFLVCASASPCQCDGTSMAFPQERSSVQCPDAWDLWCCSPDTEATVALWGEFDSNIFSDECKQQLSLLSCATMCHPNNKQFSRWQSRNNTAKYTYTVTIETANTVLLSCKNSLEEYTEAIQFLNHAFSLFSNRLTPSSKQITFEFGDYPFAVDLSRNSLECEALELLSDDIEDIDDTDTMKRQAVATNRTDCMCDGSPPHGGYKFAVNRTVNTTVCPQWSGVCCSASSEANLTSSVTLLYELGFVGECYRGILNLLCISICYPDNIIFTNWSYNTTGEYYSYTNKITNEAANTMYDNCKDLTFALGGGTISQFFPSPEALLSSLGGSSKYYTPGPGKPSINWNITDEQPSIDFTLYLPPNGPTCFDPLPIPPPPPTPAAPTPEPVAVSDSIVTRSAVLLLVLVLIIM